jgi:hypothetical protein
MMTEMMGTQNKVFAPVANGIEPVNDAKKQLEMLKHNFKTLSDQMSGAFQELEKLRLDEPDVKASLGSMEKAIEKVRENLQTAASSLTRLIELNNQGVEEIKD